MEFGRCTEFPCLGGIPWTSAETMEIPRQRPNSTARGILWALVPCVCVWYRQHGTLQNVKEWSDWAELPSLCTMYPAEVSTVLLFYCLSHTVWWSLCDNVTVSGVLQCVHCVITVPLNARLYLLLPAWCNICKFATFPGFLSVCLSDVTQVPLEQFPLTSLTC